MNAILRAYYASLMAKFAVIAAKLRASAAKFKLWAQSRARKTLQITKLLILWPQKLWIWSWKNFQVVIVFILVVAPPVVASFYCPDEDIIRWAGLWLQLAGIGTVWWGIAETRTLLKLAPFWQQVRQRLRDARRTFPPLRRDIILKAEGASVTLAGGKARAFVWNNAPPDATVEERLEAMEKNVKRVRDDLDRFEDRTDDEIAKQTKALKQEQKDRAEGEQEIRSLIVATETGGLHITISGAIFLLLGVTMSSIPAELAGFVFQPVNGFLFQ